jgi:hypothetical protein
MGRQDVFVLSCAECLVYPEISISGLGNGSLLPLGYCLRLCKCWIVIGLARIEKYAVTAMLHCQGRQFF